MYKQENSISGVKQLQLRREVLTLSKQLFVVSVLFIILGVAIAAEIQEVVKGNSDKIFFQVINGSNGAETGATCTTDVWYGNGTQIGTDLAVTNHGGGLYYFTTNVAWQPVGKMLAEMECRTALGGVSHSALDFKVVNITEEQYLANITGDIGDPSAAATTLYDYLVNTIATLINTLITRLGIPSDYGYNNVSHMLNYTLINQQNKLITVAGTVTNSTGSPIDGAAVDVGVESCTDVAACSGTIIGGYAEATTVNGRYDHQFTRAIVPGTLYRVNTTIFNGASITTTFSYFTN